MNVLTVYYKCITSWLKLHQRSSEDEKQVKLSTIIGSVPMTPAAVPGGLVYRDTETGSHTAHVRGHARPLGEAAGQQTLPADRPDK